MIDRYDVLLVVSLLSLLAGLALIDWRLVVIAAGLGGVAVALRRV